MASVRELVKKSVEDGEGNISHSRIIALLVAFAATIFMWKLILLGGMTFDYFIAYLVYGMGHQTVNKFLDLWGGKVLPGGLNQPPKQ